MMESPDYSRDFVKVPRTVLRALLDDELALRVYLELLDRAAWKAGPRIIDGRRFHLERGQAVCGRETLARAMCSTPKKTRTALARLEYLGFVAIERAKRGSVVTLLGYAETYDRTEQEGPTEGPTNGPRLGQDWAKTGPTDGPLTEIRDREIGRWERSERGVGLPPAPPPAIPPSTEYDPENPYHRGQLAERTWRSLSDLLLDVAAELRIPGVLPFPAITPGSEPQGFRDLRDRIREEGELAPVVCERVLSNLATQARKEKSIEWLSERAFRAGAWRTARETVPGQLPRQRTGPRQPPRVPEPEPPRRIKTLG